MTTPKQTTTINEIKSLPRPWNTEGGLRWPDGSTTINAWREDEGSHDYSLAVEVDDSGDALVYPWSGPSADRANGVWIYAGQPASLADQLLIAWKRWLR